MFLIKWVKKLLHFAFFAIVVGFLAAIFLGYFWYNTGIGPELYKKFSTAAPSDGILAPYSTQWFETHIKGHYSGVALGALTYLVPAGFGLLFGTGIYIVLSIAIYTSWWTIKKKRKKQQAKV